MTTSSLRVELFTGIVRRGDQVVSVNQREKSLLYTLALARRPIARDDLLDELWPDLDVKAARNALGVCLHRLRRQIGDADAVVLSTVGYALGSHVCVDLKEAEELVRSLGFHRPLSCAQRDGAERTFFALLGSPGPRIRALGETFAALQQRLDALRNALASRLAQDAIDRGEAADALLYATPVADLDPCDEPARELAIRAYLALGDRASAIREFRAYARAVGSELGLEPSAQLRRLLVERLDPMAVGTLVQAGAH
jgi:DNA-binding SARP family transcriptional activator